MDPSDVTADWSDADVRREVDENRLWYHTIEVRPGIVTPGWFDLRPIVEHLPWPDVRGKRCLDVGTYDGYLAFELERRGASEVVAVDISDHALWDWPPRIRAEGPDRLAQIAGEKGRGFEVAAKALRSHVSKIETSVYDLDPERVGSFDIVVCGSLLLHLRDPYRALEAIRSVCGERFMSCETIDVELTALHPRKPVARIAGLGTLLHWQLPNAAGHRRMLRAAGFDIERTVRPYAISFGTAHAPRPGGIRRAARGLLQQRVCHGEGVPHVAALARPA
jgi:tRNA (mo5U34)-methyltransferase